MEKFYAVLILLWFVVFIFVFFLFVASYLIGDKKDEDVSPRIHET